MCPFLAILLLSASPPAAQQALSLEPITQVFGNPHLVTHAPGDDAARVFLVTQDGRIGVIAHDQVLPAPFLDLSALCLVSYEEGLNCLAFHPDYVANGKFYVSYCDLNGDWILAEYLRDANDPDLADPASGRTVLAIPHPSNIHYSGWLEFGPDGFLYAGVGDGSPQGDPVNHAQRGDVLLGKILRIDVDHPSPGSNYGIPPSNPFVNDPNFRDEIWAYGVRNPWRCDVDDATGDLWIADVGYASWEEVDHLPAGQGGANLGWRLMEGAHCFQPSTNCDPGGLTYPVHEWAHGGVPYRCSIIGGEVYRGRSMADMRGRYFFADYCSGEVWSMRWDGNGVTDFVDHTPELAAILGPFPFIQGFGSDADGELYLCTNQGGQVYRFVPAGLRLDVPPLLAGTVAGMQVRDGNPNALVGLLASTTGLGATYLPPAGVTAGLDRPFPGSFTLTDAQGRAWLQQGIPQSVQGRTLWLQGIQLGLTSNIVQARVD